MIDKLLLSLWPEGSLEKSLNLAHVWKNIISSFLIYFISSSKKMKGIIVVKIAEKKKRKDNIFLINLLLFVFWMIGKINIIKI